MKIGELEAATDTLTIQSCILWDEKGRFCKPAFEVEIMRNGSRIISDTMYLDKWIEGDDETFYNIQDIMDEIQAQFPEILLKTLRDMCLGTPYTDVSLDP